LLDSLLSDWRDLINACNVCFLRVVKLQYFITQEFEIEACLRKDRLEVMWRSFGTQMNSQEHTYLPYVYDGMTERLMALFVL
jgi:hypothetical protein